MNPWPIFEPQDSARDLADHPNRVQLVHDAALVYPALCPNCGDAPTTYLIESADVPYCNLCIEQHEREARTLSWPQRVVVGLSSGLTISALGSGFMAFLFLPDALRDLTRPGFPWLVVVVMFFALIAYGSHAELFDTPRSTYSIRNRAFAEAFAALNRERIWNPRSPAAKRAAHSRKLVYGGALGILVAFFLWDLATDLFGR